MTRRAPDRTRIATAGATIVLSFIALSGCGLPARQSDNTPVQAAVAARPGTAAHTGTVAAAPRIRNPRNGRTEVVVPDIGRTVLLIGDSQSEPLDGWPRQALSAAGYQVHYCGRGGTGFVAANGTIGNYVDALRQGDWLLPAGTPALIVVQGGGNDAASGASDREIAGNAGQLIAELESRYPGTRIAMVGTLARGQEDGGGRRTEVDALLGKVAADNGLPFISVGDWLTRYSLAGDLADAVHMNAGGRKVLGGLLEQRLRDLGLEREPGLDPAENGGLLAVGGPRSPG